MFRTAVQERIFDLQRKRNVGVIDEGTTRFILTAVIDGITHKRSVWLFHGEPTKPAGFVRTGMLMYGLVGDLKKVLAQRPEGLVRRLLLAMLEEDADKVGELILPHPDAALLTQRRPIGPELHERLKKAYASLPLRRVVRGETVRLPNGAALKVGKEHVNENSFVIASPRPVRELPVRVVRHEGRWRVDAGPLIEARKPPARRRRRAGKR